MPPENDSKKVFLIIARHGNATNLSFSSERPLSEQGKDEANMLANEISKSDIDVDKIFHSGVLRSTETGEIISQKLKKPLEILPKLSESFDQNAAYWLTFIETLDESVLLIGHNPTINFILNLTNPNISFDFFTASAVGLLKDPENLTYKYIWQHRSN